MVQYSTKSYLPLKDLPEPGTYLMNLRTKKKKGAMKVKANVVFLNQKLNVQPCFSSQTAELQI